MAHLFQSEYSGKEVTAHIYKISGEHIWLVKEYVNGLQVKESQFQSIDQAEKFCKDLTADKKKYKKQDDSTDNE